MDTPVSLLNLIATQNDLTPAYDLIGTEGQVHAPVFTYRVELLEMVAEGSGASKKKAKHFAARNMLRRMLDETDLIEDKDTIKRILKKCEDEEATAASAQVAGQAVPTPKDSQVPGSIETIVGASETSSTSVGDQQGRQIEPTTATTTTTPTSQTGEELNPIGKLQEICMKKHWHPPVYEDVGESGDPHDRIFHMVCLIENMELQAKGVGKSKKAAKKTAACEMLAKLRRDNLDKFDELFDRLTKGGRGGGGGVGHLFAASKLNIDSQKLTKTMLGTGRAAQLMKLSKTNHNRRNSKNKKEVEEEEEDDDAEKMQEDPRAIRSRFYRDLLSGEHDDKLSRLRRLFPRESMSDYVTKYTSGCDDPNIGELVREIESLLNVEMQISIYAEKRHDGRFQVIGQAIALDAKYAQTSILCSFGADEDYERAKRKALSGCVVVLLCNLI